jgi:hypothetical protein
MGLYAAAARWWLGRLEGSPGKHTTEQAETWMRSQQIVRPDRMAALQVPGLSAVSPWKPFVGSAVAAQRWWSMAETTLCCPRTKCHPPTCDVLQPL